MLIWVLPEGSAEPENRGDRSHGIYAVFFNTIITNFVPDMMIYTPHNARE